MSFNGLESRRSRRRSRIGHHAGLLTFGAIYVLARAFANGGSSLTGIEAVSNAVSALRPPEGRNARQLLVIQGTIVSVERRKQMRAADERAGIVRRFRKALSGD